MSAKKIKFSKCYNFKENWYLEDFCPEECDSDIVISKWRLLQPLWCPFWQLFSIWSPKHITNFEVLQCSNYKEHWYLGFLEEHDCIQCDFKMAVILAAIFKIAAKMRKVSKCSNINENWYLEFFPHEECDSNKSDLEMASYLRLIL
jgi:hypothetical protein